MKRITTLLFFCFTVALIVAGCGSKLDKEKWALDKKHKSLPDYVLSSSEKVQETYVMAATYPEVIASVPCYCGCSVEGHKSNLDCFVKQVGGENAVTEWDSHGISCDTCVDIARDAVDMHLDGKSPKKIHDLITKKYENYGDPTPTPEPK
ncbi:PCYCGC motif-containing (lipo)protein [Neobacillus novalis]|uniref:PCYCGC motif-containing (Lipo)protein n=1 Tax=Neobacillus novalis TaxID=220687 RepID=A0AA95MNY6_9BACI|nr:PCYCGC motif-containing (lipo)protein [Neobacillus novalis]WHY84606.1 PCYCGC motif-containing (lipo)protein [Neobacillus novalis]